jgi:hypothetical protein
VGEENFALSAPGEAMCVDKSSLVVFVPRGKACSAIVKVDGETQPAKIDLSGNGLCCGIEVFGVDKLQAIRLSMTEEQGTRVLD